MANTARFYSLKLKPFCLLLCPFLAVPVTAYRPCLLLVISKKLRVKVQVAVRVALAIVA